MCRFWVHEDEIPEIVVRGLGLRNFGIRLRLDRVNQVGEFDRFLNEEDGDLGGLSVEHRVIWLGITYIIAHDVPIPFISVELDSKSPHVADRVCTPSTALDSGETDEDRGSARGIGQHSSRGDICGTFEEFEVAVCSGTPSMNNTFRNTFMVKTMDLMLKQISSL